MIEVELEANNSETEFSHTPPEVANIANEATLNLLPERSKKQYEIVYSRFQDWKKKKGTTGSTENILLAYFFEKAKLVKSSTLWAEYSMLKATLSVKENINIKNYVKLIAFLKRKSVGYRTKKSKIFSKEQFFKFIREAPDERYLLMKVVAIFGIAGACHRDELQKMSLEDINDLGSILVIKIPDTKTNKPRTFVVNEHHELTMLNYYRKYLSLRPSNTEIQRFFIRYYNGKCQNQVVGVNTFAKIPSEIAKYLQLPNPSEYTGHSFRRTSATMLADTGAGILSLKRHGGWSSSTVAESSNSNLGNIYYRVYYNPRRKQRS